MENTFVYLGIIGGIIALIGNINHWKIQSILKENKIHTGYFSFIDDYINLKKLIDSTEIESIKKRYKQLFLIGIFTPIILVLFSTIILLLFQ